MKIYVVGKNMSRNDFRHRARLDVLLLSFRRVLAPVEQAQEGNTFHETGSRVSKETTSGLESSIDTDMMVGGHVEVARLRRVVRSLFGDVVCSLSVFEIPVTSKYFTKNGV
jgi:hypothetical protein